ncbi:MAG: T9SS type A sorting domain-containing protein, partial [Candidatus Eisenbacteria bacterium]|nr:T9SS type A sorting domain-containing protein [Candidatus Eisenbacteria bacterium]
ERPADREPTDVPHTLVLLQNAPNPFNPETEFRFGLPWGALVRLEIYDLAGRHVRTLTEGHFAAGWNTVSWDGRGDGGERVASGVYFCWLQADGSSARRKVVVLK